MSVTALKDFTKYTGMISNSGHDERGMYRGGQAGDQSGTEWQIRSWYRYSSGWNAVIRFKDQKVAAMFATIEIYAALNNYVGYDMSDRLTYAAALEAADYDPRKIKVACEEDCSAGVLANARAALILTGHKTEADKISLAKGYTGNMEQYLTATGMVELLTDAKYLTGYAYLKPGDILLNRTHHTCAYVGGTFGTASTGTSASSTGRSSTTSAKASAPVYKVGKTYTIVASALQVRIGAGTTCRRKKHSELTPDGQKHDSSGTGCLEKGTKITCMKIAKTGSDIWIMCPSGWIAAYYKGNVYVK